MAYNIVYKKSVRRDLKKLSKAESQRVLNQIEEELSENADTYPVLKGPFAGLRKYRIGDYRVIYAILGDDVLVLRIGHRKEVYKKKI
ncbi:MAG: type II toxin-antitoxin system RelE/ParE family toxin [Deltaproteobacteria bacterium]|nr:type II toxin-antitoxin system RelE/ParE family toxin [Deltaproteobacteria bacterium]